MGDSLGAFVGVFEGLIDGALVGVDVGDARQFPSQTNLTTSYNAA